MTRFAELCQELEGLAQKVGLEPSPISPEMGLEFPAAHWRGPYAQCLAVELPDLDEATFTRAWRGAQDWLDSCLKIQEGDDLGPVDGYLVLALPSCPGDDLRKQIQHAELNTVACRKHVTWPDQLGQGTSSWPGLLHTAVLGLPDDSGPSSSAEPPELDAQMTDLLSLINEHGAPRAARIELGEE